MAQWGMSDASSNAVLWAPSQVKLTPNTTNRDSLYGNTTADAFVTGATVGMFAVDNLETPGYANVTTVAVSAAGSGFTARPTVVFAAPNLAGGTTATGNATAKVVSANVGVSGTSYVNAEVVTIDGGTGTAANVSVTTDASGNVTAVALVSGQTGSYTVLPSLANNAATGGSGSGLQLNLSIGLNTVTVTANGSGYSTAPAVTIGGAGGSGAAAVASINTSEGKRAAHSGWVLRTEGSGGRAGRVQYEVLVAGNIVSDNNSDDTLLKP